MSDKKHIDRIFQEKLKDFEATPNPHVWENIQNQLNQNTGSTKKAFPLWLRLASIAAILLLFFTIGNRVFNSGNSEADSNEILVETEDASKTPNSETKNSNNTILKPNQNNNSSSTEEGIASEGSNTTDLNSKLDPSNANLVDPNSSQLSSNTSKENNSNTTTTTRDILNNKSYSNKTTTGNPVVTNTDALNTKTSSEENDNNLTSQSKTKYATANVDANNKSSSSSRSLQPELDKDKTANTLTNQKKSTQENAVVDNINSNEKNTAKLKNDVNRDALSKTERTTSNAVTTNNKTNSTSNLPTPELDKNKADKVLTDLKNTTQDAVVDNTDLNEENTTKTNEDEESKEDSPSIEEEIAKAKDIIEEEEEKVNRWQVYANIAPVYYNTLGKGSHIDDQFVNNNKSGEINTSYGINVSYAFNERLSLRTGVSSLKLSYDTDDVIIYENVDVDINTNSNPLRNLVFAENANGSNQLAISAISQENLIVQQFNGSLGNNFQSALSQRIGYYEVPLELKYRLLNKRFGVNVIGGFSTFILNDNKVYSEFEDNKRYIGETNNINDVSFSGNLGLGLDYEFSKKVKLNIEPTFKYQFNAYENTSGNFRPYIIGVYTGLSYKF